MPVTTLDELIVATDGSELLHTPDADINGMVVVAPTHTALAPPIAPALGNAVTVTTCVAYAVPQKLVMR